MVNGVFAHNASAGIWIAPAGAFFYPVDKFF
jgi:hypothetical protein